MDLFSFLATIILITSVVTLVVALAAYVAYKIRDIRKPKKRKSQGKNELEGPIFLKPLTGAALQEIKHAIAKDKSARVHAKNISPEQIQKQRANRHSPVNPNNRQ